MPNTLFYGDNLQVLREHVPDDSLDLVSRAARKCTTAAGESCTTRTMRKN